MQYEQRAEVNREYLTSLDLMKLICAVLVIAIHVPLLGTGSDNLVVQEVGYYIQQCFTRIAVPLFFACSGYLLYRKTTLDSFSLKPTKKFLLGILRLYLIWSVIYLPLSIQRLSQGDATTQQMVLSYFQDFFFTGSFQHLWYLPSLMVAVILVSLLLRAHAKPSVIVVISFALYIVGLLGQSWFGLIAPLQDAAASRWEVIQNIHSVILTTRNGLFEGFAFVSIGMLFGFFDFKISRNKALAGFIISMVLLLAEACVVKQYDMALDINSLNMYLMLLPSVFFGFAFFAKLEFSKKHSIKIIQPLSSMMYFSHMLFATLTFYLIDTLGGNALVSTCLPFLITLGMTVAFSLAIVELSNLRGMRWLKKAF